MRKKLREREGDRQIHSVIQRERDREKVKKKRNEMNRKRERERERFNTRG